MVRAMAASDSRVGGPCAITKCILSLDVARAGAKSLTFTRVERVAQSVADEIERKNAQENGNARPYRHPRCIRQESLRGIEHRSPGWIGRLLAQAKKGQRGLGDDGGRNRKRRLHQKGGHDIWQNMHERDAPARVAYRP